MRAVFRVLAIMRTCFEYKLNPTHRTRARAVAVLLRDGVRHSWRRAHEVVMF